MSELLKLFNAAQELEVRGEYEKARKNYLELVERNFRKLECCLRLAILWDEKKV